MLTRKQSELLAFIAQYQEANGGVSPSFEEMMAEMGIVSKSGVHRVLSSLEERGFIERQFNRNRAITVIRLPKPLTTRNAYTSLGKEVLHHDRHFADATSPMAALAIAAAMNATPTDTARAS